MKDIVRLLYHQAFDRSKISSSISLDSINYYEIYLYRDTIESQDFQKNPYKYLRHESSYVIDQARKLIKETK